LKAQDEPMTPGTDQAKYQKPPQQQFLANTIRLGQFSNKRVPKETDSIVYVSGSFDLLHHGHLKRLEEAKKLGDFLYIGLWDDEMTRYYRGENFPIVPV
jgi:ethanolamine-phosphate cytidylyltransferase